VSRGACAREVTRRACSLPWHLRGLLLAAWASGAFLIAAPPAAFAEPVSTSPPVISGALEVEQAVTASTGTWTDTSPIVSYAYQWLRCNASVCTNIDYANSNPYTLPWSFAGSQAEVTVTATDAQGESNFATSAMTSVIANGPSYTVGESAVGAGSVTGFETGREAAGKTADANLACPGACGARYPYLPGTEVELSATPAPGSTFLGWGGACSGSAPTCSFTLSSNEAATATFSGQAISTPVLPLPLKYETEAGEAQPPSAGAPGMGAWEPPPPSAASLPARLTSIRYRRHRIQAEVRCQEARTCRLSLAISAGISTSHPMIARRSFTVPAQRSARISLALDRQSARILAKRHRLPVTARLMLSGAGHASVVEQGRFTLTA
jgi:Divergent InlB B-repeat domain